MKKIFKSLINIFIRFFVDMLTKINLGRYILDIINKNIIERKKTVICKDLKLNFYVPNRLSYFRVNTFHSKEPETLEWIENFEKESIFWDVGANIGLYSCYAAKKKNCKVYAFEPSIFNLEWLGKNIFLNSLENKIVIVSLPLNETIAENDINFSSTEWGGALSTFGKKYGHDGKDLEKIFGIKTIAINMDSIKNFFETPQPDYIKIDVDGIEHLILSGGEKVLLNTKEILIEINDKFEEQKNNCTKSLKRLGFSLKEKRKSKMFENTDFSGFSNQIWVRKL